jgi:hypothetical protein
MTPELHVYFLTFFPQKSFVVAVVDGGGGGLFYL